MKSCPVASPLVVAILLSSWLATCIRQTYRLPAYQRSDDAWPGYRSWRKVYLAQEDRKLSHTPFMRQAVASLGRAL